SEIEHSHVFPSDALIGSLGPYPSPFAKHSLAGNLSLLSFWSLLACSLSLLVSRFPPPLIRSNAIALSFLSERQQAETASCRRRQDRLRENPTQEATSGARGALV
ncbi:hypothetical protein ISCGN_030841, partial [Ixodes scapularis]